MYAKTCMLYSSQIQSHLFHTVEEAIYYLGVIIGSLNPTITNFLTNVCQILFSPNHVIFDAVEKITWIRTLYILKLQKI